MNTTATATNCCIHCVVPREQWPGVTSDVVKLALREEYDEEEDLFPQIPAERTAYCLGHLSDNVVYQVLVCCFHNPASPPVLKFQSNVCALGIK